MRGEERVLKNRRRTKSINNSRKGVGCQVAARLFQGLHSDKPIRGFSHGFYRYPARFSPEFARSVIEVFSKPGDTILDPFVGGGTTVVEALVSGRKVVGVDLNPLAVFIARVKSTPLSLSEIALVRRLTRQLHNQFQRVSNIRPKTQFEGIFENVPWRIRNCILVTLHQIRGTRNRRVRDFLRCGLLKTAQWALDNRETIPSSQQFFQIFCVAVLEMCKQMEEYRLALQAAGISSGQRVCRFRRLLLRSAVNVHQDGRLPSGWLPVKLVVTSPPYPGVHVLYNRWQVQGRRETRAPFAILNHPDGHFPSFYTFGDRRQVEPYFETLTAVYRSIANLLTSSSLVVQLISFNNSKRDIDRFLDAMEAAGFDECSSKDIGLGTTERVWRLVPNRKWYTGYRDGFHAGRELLLFHRIKRA